MVQQTGKQEAAALLESAKQVSITLHTRLEAFLQNYDYVLVFSKCFRFSLIITTKMTIATAS